MNNDVVLKTAGFIAIWAVSITVVFGLIVVVILNHMTKKYSKMSLWQCLKCYGMR
jgi:uncharacterized membrane protein YagU involved in acid resistance